MKILQKDKIRKKRLSLNRSIDFMNNIKEDVSYDDHIATILLSFTITLPLVFFQEAYYLIPISLSTTWLFLNTKYCKKKKQIWKFKKKVRRKHNEIRKEDAELSVEENYQIFYNELINLKGKPQLEKISPNLIQEIIEEYRKKDELNLPKLTNQERLDYFTKNEVYNSKSLKNKNEVTLEILNE